ncbi:MAG TPA: phenylalanine--tRNA ligase beta subunit-related protein, partial [Patescibacteria group bacterium]|nr:phenylalanine--tRNA ligase beta subunit-related protein [Patescibacteria group bacterium]
MNIKILDSWLKDYLKTEATAAKIAENLSLTSVSVERVEPFGSAQGKKDHIYDIEITTNRPDLMSVIGLAREAATILPQFDIKAKFTEPDFKHITNTGDLGIKIENDPKLVNRICAIALDITLKASPKEISERLEAGDIRSINNAVDVTNYVMREVGHPMHVFDYDKLLKTGKMIVRLSKPGETIKTLDNKEYKLAGGDIVIDNGEGEIIDLMAVMGTLNSAVDESTKRVMLFVDNCDQHKIRKTSMNLAIRSEAAILNEKGVDRELALPAILRGVELLKDIADAKVISEIVDIYPNKLASKTVEVTQS